MEYAEFYEQEIWDILADTSFPSSGVEVPSYSTISYYDPDLPFISRSTSDAISVAFSGQGVQSAVYQFRFEDKYYRSSPLTVVEHQTRAFRDRLGFPIDDGRVLGFVFDGAWNGPDYPILDAPCDLFPSIELIRIQIVRACHWFGILFRIHLVRI